MTTVSSPRWASKPGSLNALNQDILFLGAGQYGIPVLAPFEGELPERLVPYGQRLRGDEAWAGSAVHFFLDDYRFERVFARPRKTLSVMTTAGIALTPDFSLFRDWPKAMQVWNVYRSRWCGAWWQQNGVQVIPTLQWSTDESFEYAFDGLPPQSVVAVSMIGVAPRYQLDFEAGYLKMVERLAPKTVLFYGQAPDWAREFSEVKEYPTFWKARVVMGGRGKP